MAEQTRQHKGWQFVLVTDRDIVDDVALDDEANPSWPEIEQGKAHADKLSVLGEHQAAYLILWIAVEQAPRKLALEVRLPSGRLAPGVVIRQLHSEGALSIRLFDELLECLAVRNRVVHGRHSPELMQFYQRLRAAFAEILTNADEEEAI